MKGRLARRRLKSRRKQPLHGAAVRNFIGILSILILAAGPALARPSMQPVPRPAPEWDVSEWINSQGMDLADLKGQVVVIEFFQLWCPGCNAFSIPLMKFWHQTFAKELDEGDLKIVSIHTVFEGFAYQTTRRLRGFLKRKKIHHPVGVDRVIKGQRLPQTMRRFGTTWERPRLRLSIKRG